MSTIPTHLRPPFQAGADPEAVVRAGQIRFTVLTPRVIRMEFDPQAQFEERPSQPFWYRRQPVPSFTAERSDAGLTLQTEYLQLTCDTSRPFSPDSLTIVLRQNGTRWQYGDANPDNLLGTTRTLDEVSGSTRLEKGLLSRAGWAVVDDSATLVFEENGWLTPRESGAESQDLYFFGHGRDYQAALRDYFALTGPVPLLPRWALGNWWSRYWAYSAAELQELMLDFQAHGVPLSVCILDMDWHLVDVGKGVNGWTGYTWNRNLFPDPEYFLNWLHQQKLKTALNLHPALGVRPHEARYPRLAKRLGMDPAAAKPIPFDIADPEFAIGYLEELHHPLEKEGVDFWWLDWQQGEESSMPGLDPLWWLNHLHFYDLGRSGEQRPFIFSRWGGLGNHRYPIGFSGDTHVDWPTLQFQPYFTATAANVGFGWWSHDIGGHYFGVEDGELYTRWVQYGVFSPIFRLHSSNNPFLDRRPWAFDADVLQVSRAAMQLRHALVPYLYSLSWQYFQEGTAPIRPMYHDYAHNEEAYRCPQQYTFGPALIAAPFTTPREETTNMSAQPVWLPPGEWYDFFSGERINGERWVTMYGRLADIPVFARTGAIVPLAPLSGGSGVEIPAQLTYHIFAGADGQFALFEDDGETTAYQQGSYGITISSQQWRTGDDHSRQGRIQIGPLVGEAAAVPAERDITLRLYGFNTLPELTITIDARPVRGTITHEQETECVVVRDLALMPAQQLIVGVTAVSTQLQGRDRRHEKLLAALKTFRLENETKVTLAANLAQFINDPARLQQYGTKLSQAQLAQLTTMCQTETAPIPQ